MQLHASTPLDQAVYRNPILIPVLSRFGLRPGLGEKSIAELAREHRLDLDFFLLVLNTYLNEDYFPEAELQQLSAEPIREYLQRTQEYYLNVQLPNIEKHLGAFIRTSLAGAADTGAPAEQREFHPPALLGRLLRAFEEALRKQLHEQPSDPPAEQILAEMQLILIRFLSGEYNENLCYATLFALKSLERDLIRHRRIRERLLHPVLEAERNGKRAPERNREKQPEPPAGRQLTRREKEVLKWIVAGKLNKEIAAELGIGFQTVLSHRKNITAKLGIKTVSGLTFYAIMNGLVRKLPEEEE